jgi:hypothetical protein
LRLYRVLAGAAQIAGLAMLGTMLERQRRQAEISATRLKAMLEAIAMKLSPR